MYMFFFKWAGDHLYLHVLTHSFPTRRSSELRIADVINWARIPMPGSLGHINSWLRDDADGVAVVDTGICLTMCSDAWKALYAGALKDKRITRVIGTHLHPDHIGLAGWIAKKQDVKLWMTRGEMLTARAIVADSADTAPDEVIVQSSAAGGGAKESGVGKKCEG